MRDIICHHNYHAGVMVTSWNFLTQNLPDAETSGRKYIQDGVACGKEYSSKFYIGALEHLTCHLQASNEEQKKSLVQWIKDQGIFI